MCAKRRITIKSTIMIKIKNKEGAEIC